MKPLPTKYSNTTFRSRTEARWAVFFDKMIWKWKYEDQGYELESGERYLPDFELRLPNQDNWFVEVKPDNFDKFENDAYMMKLLTFVHESSSNLIILDGNPSCKPFDIVSHKFSEKALGMGLLQDYDPYIRWCDEYWFAQIKTCSQTGQHTLDFDDRTIAKDFGKSYLKAINETRDYKFGI